MIFSTTIKWFFFGFSTEEQERQAYKIKPDEKLQTRYMFYDMIRWRDESYD
jgi:hypothetical protein